MAKIFYFTGTGNCYSVANRLSKRLNAELVAVTHYLDNPSEVNDEVIGIVTPVYSTDLPPIMVDFLEKLQLNGAKYIFCVATMGAMAGRTLYHAKEILNRRNLILHAGFTVQLPDNSIIFPSGMLRTHKLLKAEAEAVNTISSLIEGREENSAVIKDFFFWKIAAGIGMWTLRVVLDVKHKKLNEAKCNGCGICAKICQAGCIKMENGRPSFSDEGCLTCFGCAQWCPREAISLGHLHPMGKTKYVHPDVTVQDIVGSSES
ncbi:MAG: EFR1 family ferrodoxin [Acidaminococcaceae bacterium]|nr:EFR1 family ferrodoxin [Acidaminococcaceae bacterium]